MEGSSFTGDPEGCVLEGSGDEASLSMGAVRETWRGVPLLGILKDVFWKALETGIYLHRGPVREPGGGLIYQ